MARPARTAVIGMVTAAAVAAVALGGAAAATKPATRNLTVSGTKLKFNVSALTAPKGAVVLKLTNNSPSIKHSIAIKGSGIATKKGKIVSRGGVSKVSITLAPGRYTYFCFVEEHAKAGMKGTLTITGR